MEKAHVDSVMILVEAFACQKPFDFGKQETATLCQAFEFLYGDLTLRVGHLRFWRESLSLA